VIQGGGAISLYYYSVLQNLIGCIFEYNGAAYGNI
jgi:hypothetical protein